MVALCQLTLLEMVPLWQRDPIVNGSTLSIDPIVNVSTLSIDPIVNGSTLAI